jgi:hypothetical protein
VDSTSGYIALRNGLPKFLQLVAADSSLLIEQSDGSLVVSFPRVLGYRRHELARFAVYDITLAFLLGVPSLVEYGHEGTCDSNGRGFEWIHGIPVAFLQIIPQVSSWRAGSRTLVDDWKILEQRVLEWESPYAVLEGCSKPESANFERAMVQEGWRHVLLIYIYMVRGPAFHSF